MATNCRALPRHALGNGDDAVSKRGAEASTREARRTGRTRAKSEHYLPCGACQGAERQDGAFSGGEGGAKGSMRGCCTAGGVRAGSATPPRALSETSIRGQRARGHKLPRTTASRAREWRRRGLEAGGQGEHEGGAPHGTNESKIGALLRWWRVPKGRNVVRNEAFCGSARRVSDCPKGCRCVVFVSAYCKATSSGTSASCSPTKYNSRRPSSSSLPISGIEKCAR